MFEDEKCEEANKSFKGFFRVIIEKEQSKYKLFCFLSQKFECILSYPERLGFTFWGYVSGGRRSSKLIFDSLEKAERYKEELFEYIFTKYIKKIIRWDVLQFLLSLKKKYDCFTEYGLKLGKIQILIIDYSYLNDNLILFKHDDDSVSILDTKNHVLNLFNTIKIPLEER
ncbi:hypothetical protein DRO30_01335 [Candidatus Bathyarchaeota archaeon]|nr:MAG: hypothetical protein DRO30_01335 [Candidatus Bathyarchaeota archaeon]